MWKVCNIARNQTMEAKLNKLDLWKNNTDNKTNIVKFLYSDKLASFKSTEVLILVYLHHSFSLSCPQGNLPRFQCPLSSFPPLFSANYGRI